MNYTHHGRKRGAVRIAISPSGEAAQGSQGSGSQSRGERLIAQRIGPAGAPAPAGACHTTRNDKPRVLLVDDDRSVLDALGTAIESEGFEWSTPQTVTRLSKSFATIDVVLLDLNMPGKGRLGHLSPHISYAVR